MNSSTTHRLLTRTQRIFLAKCGLAGSLILNTFTIAWPQGVGINTTTPDPSSALDIQATDKGILIPRVDLQNSVDGTTVPNPATGLMVFNVNTNYTDANGAVSGVGLYMNTGTPAAPNWQDISKFKLPYNRSTSLNSGTTAFRINDFGNSGSATTLHTFSQNGYALHAQGKVQIDGNGQEPGLGKVLTSDASGNASWKGGVAFSLRGILTNGAHILAPKVTYKVPFDNEAYDTRNSYFLHNQSPADSFVAPEGNGIYHLDAKVSWFTGNTPAAVMLVREHAGQITILHQVISGSPFIVSQDVYLQEGDLVYINIVNNANADGPNIQLESSYFNGRFVQSL